MFTGFVEIGGVILDFVVSLEGCYRRKWRRAPSKYCSSALGALAKIGLVFHTKPNLSQAPRLSELLVLHLSEVCILPVLVESVVVSWR